MKASPVLFMGIVLTCASAGADEPAPLWEFGIGAYALSVPAYRGSEQRQAYLLPLPYFQFRGDRLRWDRDGGRLRVLGGGRVRLDLSLAASPPSDNDPDSPRRGMPDLDPTLEFGPQLQFLLGQSASRQNTWTLSLPLRKVVVVDHAKLRSAGWMFAPYIQYEHRDRWKTTVSAGPMFATQPYHDYFYQVDNAYAGTGRPAYDAEAGYSGSRITLGISRRVDRYWFGAFARYDYLGGATFADSPLVTTDHSFMFGAGVAWIFAESKRAATAPPTW